MKKKRPLRIGLLLIILLLGAYCSKGIFTYYFFSTHDGDHHIARSFEAIAALNEGHFPLRWAGDLNFHCGVPIFNFFYPLIYYLVYLINLVTGDVIASLKVIYISSFIVAPIFFYLWLLRETKKHLPSFVGAILYLFVPYRFLLIFVRNSPEFVSYTILPILLYLNSGLFKEEIKDKKIYWLGFLTAIVGGCLTISHNFTIMFVYPIIGLYYFYQWFISKDKSKKKTLFMLFTFLSFFGLAAFFLGPVFLEQGNIKLATESTINFREHFPTLKQLIRSPWGYFYSSPGVVDDGMSFMLGYAQWATLFFTGIFLIVSFFKDKKKLQRLLKDSQIIFWFLISLLLIFLILPYSMFIWEKIKLLQKIQFSWRLLGMTSFTIAALGGFLTSVIKKKYFRLFFALIILFLAIYGNRNHLLPQPVNDIDWYHHYESLHPNRHTTTTFADDILNKKAEKPCEFDDRFVNDLVKKESFDFETERGNTFGKVIFEGPREEVKDLRFNLEYFPGAFQLVFNGNRVDNYDNCSGRICLKKVKVFQGDNTLEWKVVQTPVQKIFNYISLSFLVLWIIILFRKEKIFPLDESN